MTKLRETNPVEFLDLVLACGSHTLGNPIAVRIIEAAPNPTAVNQYISSLGWPGVVAARIRHGVQVKQQAGNKWSTVIKTDITPAEAMLSLERKNDTFPGVTTSTHLCLA